MSKKKKADETAPGPEPIYLLELVEENFRRLRFAHVQIEEGGRLLRVTGKNKQGKTSLLEGALALFRGTRQVPEEALNDDATKGRLWGRFSNGFIIERRFTQAAPKGYLKIVGKDGGEHKQTLIDQWLGGSDADPMYLWALDPKKRRELLLRLAGEGVEAELQRLAAEAQRIEEVRKPFNSTVQRVNRLKPPEVEKPEPVDVADLMGRYQGLQKAAREIEDHSRELAQARNAHEQAQLAVKEAEATLARLRGVLDEQAQRLADLQEVDMGPDPSEELAQVREALNRADQDRDALAKWSAYEAELSAGEAAAEKAKELTAERDALLEERQKLVAGLDTGVPGLTFDAEGEPLIYGKPEAYLSGAQRVTFAADVCFASNPQLKLLLIDEGDALDDDSLAQLATRGAEKGFHVLVCTLGREGPGEIVVDDGVALSEGLEAPQEEEQEEVDEAEEGEEVDY